MKHPDNHLPKRSGRLFRRLALVILILLLGYGILLTGFGIFQYAELSKAKANGTAVTVQITELQRSAPHDRTLIVVLKPVSEKPRNEDQIGRTIATTINQHLAIGDTLTMYYNPQNPQERTVDFGTAKPLMQWGALLTGLAALLLMTMILIQKASAKRKTPTEIVQHDPD